MQLRRAEARERASVNKDAIATVTLFPGGVTVIYAGMENVDAKRQDTSGAVCTPGRWTVIKVERYGENEKQKLRALTE